MSPPTVTIYDLRRIHCQIQVSPNTKECPSCPDSIGMKNTFNPFHRCPYGILPVNSAFRLRGVNHDSSALAICTTVGIGSVPPAVWVWQGIKGELQTPTFLFLNRTVMSSSHLSANTAKAIDAAETAETSTPGLTNSPHLSTDAQTIATVNTADVKTSTPGLNPGPVSHRALVKSSSNIRQSYAKLSQAATSSKKAKGYAKGQKIIGKGKERRGGEWINQEPSCCQKLICLCF